LQNSIQATAIGARRLYSTENLPAPGAGGSDPKIASIVDEISKLTLLQTADLVSQLKVTYYITRGALRFLSISFD
jgi:Ribosomal protein L7/L12 dimerisation domain